MTSLPSKYMEYFAGTGPKEGSLAVDPGWFQLWAPDEIVGLNESYKVSEYAVGFVGFGSSGGGEMLAFDQLARVFMLPFVGMSPQHARLVAESWDEFVAKIEK